MRFAVRGFGGSGFRVRCYKVRVRCSRYGVLEVRGFSYGVLVVRGFGGSCAGFFVICWGFSSFGVSG